MLTSKQRAELRRQANKIDTIFQVGKGGIPDSLIKQVEDALIKRELIKMRVLDAFDGTARDAAEEIAKKVSAEVVQVIGSKFALYRESLENPSVSLGL